MPRAGIIHSMKVLVVEDSVGHATLIRELLENVEPGRFDVVVAPDLSAAVARLLDEGADIVLLDLGLPDAQGMESLEQVRTAALDAPVVVLSGRDDDEHLHAADDARRGIAQHPLKDDWTHVRGHYSASGWRIPGSRSTSS